MKAKIACLAMGLFLLALAVLGADPANDRFKGGSYDGWGQTMTEYTSLTPPVSTIIKIR